MADTIELLSPNKQWNDAMVNQRLQRLQAALDKRQPDLTLFLEKVHKPHNLSAILRTCDAVGMFEVHAVTTEEGFSYRRRSSSGMGRWVNVVRHASVAAGLKKLRGAGKTVYAAHLSDDAVDYRSLDFTVPTAILMGSELAGVSDRAASLVDGLVTIPMMGLGASLNVSVAAALILYEAQRQKMAAGHYDIVRLDPECYHDTLFEWLYPRVADECKRRCMPYPPLDGDGTIVTGSLPGKQPVN